MRFLPFLSLLGLAQIGLTSAIPALKHAVLHNERREAAAMVETVTTILYQTMVWVDKHGKVVSTQIHDLPSQAVSPPSQTTPVIPTKFGGSGPPPSRPNVPFPPQQTSDQPQHVPSISSSISLTASSAQADNSKSTESATKDSANANSKSSSTAPNGLGICYDMINSQSQCKSQSTIAQEFSFLKSQGYGIIRVYDIGCPIGDFTTAAAQSGLKLMVGLNTIANLNGDLSKLIGMVNGEWSTIDTVYIGNELVNDGAASSGQVAAAVSTARGILTAAGYNGNVITVDAFNVMQADGTVCSTSDYCAANAHAFFDPNTAAADAGQFVLNAYNSVVKANNGKKVVITESGWPWQGSCNGKACPSYDNQKTAVDSIMTSFSGMPGNLFVFQAYNAGYKQPGPQGVEQWFGIYDTDHYIGGIGPT